MMVHHWLQHFLRLSLHSVVTDCIPLPKSLLQYLCARARWNRASHGLVAEGISRMFKYFVVFITMGLVLGTFRIMVMLGRFLGFYTCSDLVWCPCRLRLTLAWSSVSGLSRLLTLPSACVASHLVKVQPKCRQCCTTFGLRSIVVSDRSKILTIGSDISDGMLALSYAVCLVKMLSGSRICCHVVGVFIGCMAVGHPLLHVQGPSERVHAAWLILLMTDAHAEVLVLPPAYPRRT